MKESWKKVYQDRLNEDDLEVKAYNEKKRLKSVLKFLLKAIFNKFTLTILVLGLLYFLFGKDIFRVIMNLLREINPNFK